MTNWEGVWYQEEGSNLYRSKAISKKKLRELVDSEGRNARILIRHNPYWNKTNNTPRYQFKIINASDEAKVIEDDEINYKQLYEELRVDSARMMQAVLGDIQYEDYSQAENTAYDFLQHWGM